MAMDETRCLIKKEAATFVYVQEQGECFMAQLPYLSELNTLRERHLERWALKVCRYPTFTACLKAYGIAPTMQVKTPKGKTLTVSASHIYGARTKFFATLDLEEALCHLTLVGEKFVPLFQEW